MDNLKDIRWKQRFENFDKSYKLLKKYFINKKSFLNMNFFYINSNLVII